MATKDQRIELKDVTFHKIKMWIRSKFRRTRGGLKIKEEDLVPFSEIILYRALSCSQCTADGACRKDKGGCGCPTPQLYAALDAECGKKPEFGEKMWHSLPSDTGEAIKEWEKFKKDNRIYLTIGRY